jgi:hypothetical protein
MIFLSKNKFLISSFIIFLSHELMLVYAEKVSQLFHINLDKISISFSFRLLIACLYTLLKSDRFIEFVDQVSIFGVILLVSCFVEHPVKSNNKNNRNQIFLLTV